MPTNQREDAVNALAGGERRTDQAKQPGVLLGPARPLRQARSLNRFYAGSDQTTPHRHLI